ncbi:MAG TPA: cupredoxin domain-containing protein [Thermoanaerobaculia bacterium]|jgi:plastocyanin|nr:cupredoxin domain-containing protein [Thermoanaerobaculia bacterium]
MRKLFVLTLCLVACNKSAPKTDLTIGGQPKAKVTVLCEAIATKESGPKDTVATFGEVYAFSPTAIAVHRDEPTEITFWNLQSDDEHDFMLLNDRNSVLSQFKLPPLKKTTVVFTFHRDGIYRFVCTMHQPEMAGAITVAPPAM